jgi:hypothetical protein
MAKHRKEQANSIIPCNKTKYKVCGCVQCHAGCKGEPMTDIFIEDKLHMNAKGYAI